MAKAMPITEQFQHFLRDVKQSFGLRLDPQFDLEMSLR
jgi:hypothetical protein